MSAAPFTWKKSQILELVTHTVELDLRRDETATSKVLYDQQIPELHTSNSRQVDTAIYVTSGGRTFLHIVEVQDRASPMGVQMVDLAIGKAVAIGAHRVTLVARAGFTKGALDRVRGQHSATIDAIKLRPGKVDEWRPNWGARSVPMTFVINQQSVDAPTQHSRYIDALSGKARYDILFGHTIVAGAALLLCQLVDPDAPADTHGFLRATVIGRGGGLRAGDIGGLTVLYNHEGRHGEATQKMPLEPL
jgi:hypothetical protein